MWSVWGKRSQGYTDTSLKCGQEAEGNKGGALLLGATLRPPGGNVGGVAEEGDASEVSLAVPQRRARSLACVGLQLTYTTLRVEGQPNSRKAST